MSQLEHVYAVILAGGSGTRLWPKSRDNTPKQFLRLGGERTLMQSTVDRILPIIPVERVIVITNEKYRGEVIQQLPQVPEANIIAEPDKRDTAMAMALGAAIAQQRDPEAVVINMASDHVLQSDEGYRDVISTAVEIARDKQHLLTVGIKPTTPNVNFGYIRAFQPQGERNGHTVYAVDSFKEKPDLATAESFLAEGHYYWNANMYTWHVETIMAAFAEFMPEMFALLQTLRTHIDQPSFAEALAEAYGKAEKISIDYAISEKAKNLLLLSGEFGWDDIGLWSTVYELGKKDANGVVIVQESEDDSRVLSLDSQNNLVNTNGKMVVTLGVEDLMIIDSDEVVFVLPRSRAADVKKVVDALKADPELTRYL